MDSDLKHTASILLVDDDPTNLRFLQEVLKDDYKIYAAPSGARALKFLAAAEPSVILLDIEMPNMNGYEVIRKIKEDARLKSIPIIFLTAQEGREKEQEAFDLGAVDYILKPITPGIVRSRVGLHVELESYRKDLEYKIDLRTRQLKLTQDAILDMLAGVTSYRDNETGGHIKRTTCYSEVLVNNLIKKNRPGYQIDEAYAQSIIKTAKLHDIGKVAVPDTILLKPDKLNDEEFDKIKMHTIYGAQMIDDSIEELGDTSDFLLIAREIVISHHEKWNGAGYPNKLKGEDIPLSGRIMALSDVYDALISRRPYKKGFSHEDAMNIIYKDSGTHFDPVLVELSEDCFTQFREIAERFR
ncbi:MAG: response regulator, partial [Acidaminococcales bacterium]|nr:response regulator [Acidaminococcales bacterium]